MTASPLVASRALGVLDELRVPYAVAGGDGARGSWASVSPGPGAPALHWYTGADGGEPGRFSLGDGALWGRLAPAGAVRALVERDGGRWRRDLPVIDVDGRRRASVWRSAEGGTILPFDPDEVVAGCRSERYAVGRGPARPSARAAARRAYYRLRPLMPRRIQIALRRGFSRVQARADFPRWPAETALHDLCDLVLSAVAHAAGAPVPYIAPWPRGHRWALVYTHDVETAAGRDAIARVRAVEAAAGVRSSWNLVPERYEVLDGLVADIAAQGCEVGVHGLRHDGRDLESLRTLRRRAPEMRRWARRWGAVGFRAPATQRQWEWMPLLGFDYDSSYPDTDPYEPIAGGCCWWLPFLNGDLVELPITLVQDHTAFVILRRDEGVWHEKAELLRRRGGMALLITHPDYLVDDEPLRAYERFLQAYRGDATAWKALPREVSDWWRRRARTSLELVDGAWRPRGPGAAEATIAYARPRTPGRQTVQLNA